LNSFGTTARFSLRIGGVFGIYEWLFVNSVAAGKRVRIIGFAASAMTGKGRSPAAVVNTEGMQGTVFTIYRSDQTGRTKNDHT